MVFLTSGLEPCLFVLCSPQTGNHGIIGIAVNDITSGGDDVWEQAIEKLKKRFSFLTLGSEQMKIFAVEGHTGCIWVHAPTLLVSRRSHCIKRVVVSAFAAEALGLSQATAGQCFCS